MNNKDEQNNAIAEKVQEIELSNISDFPKHPFKVNDDERMLELIKSVSQYGVIIPVIIRPKEDGNFEMISGHRRKRACEILGLKKIKCIIKDLSDDDATILMVDSNIQREEILPSEKAYAYKMKLDALKNQGKRTDLEINGTLSPLATKLDSAGIIAMENNESRDQIYRYIRLTYLIPELLEEVDKKRIAFRPAVEISFLSEKNQYVILNKLEYDEVSPSLSQAITLKKMQQEETITEKKIEDLLDKLKPNQKEFIKIKSERIEDIIPKKVKETGDIEDFIILCVKEHNKREKIKEERKSR